MLVWEQHVSGHHKVCFVAVFVRFLRWRKASKMWAAKGRKEGTEVQPGVQ